MNTTEQEKVEQAIAPAVSALGFQLLGTEWSNAPGARIIRIYIDAENGVTLSDCQQVSMQISAVLDVDDSIHGRYHLEVSSPGINRRLFTLDQVQQYIGEKVRIRLSKPQSKRRQYIGTLQEVTETENVVLVVEGEPHQFAWDEIEKANLKPDNLGVNL